MRQGGRGSFRGRLLMAAFLVRALPSGAVFLGGFFDEVGSAAIGAWMRDDAIPTRELALRIAAASVEDFPPAAAAFEDFAFLAIGAGYAGGDGFGAGTLDAVAIGIAGAAEELTEA